MAIPNVAKRMKTNVKDSRQYTIDEKSIGFIMDILAQYKDPVGSVVRELVSNALDSHEEAGVTDRLVEVEIDREDYFFIVRDFGLGMAKSFVDTIYTSYGASTKRESNDYMGMFGLGSKSPYGYTDRFYVNTVKDGVECKFMMYREDDKPDYTLLLEEETDKCNGTEIKVPINYKSGWNNDIRDFERAIRKQLAYMQVKFINCDIEDYSIFRFNNFVYNPVIEKDSYKEPIHICYGNVYYPIDYSQLDEYDIRRYNNKGDIGLYFDIGELDVVPTREALKYTKRTKAAIAEKFQEFKKEYQEALDKQISDIAKLEELDRHNNALNIPDTEYAISDVSVDGDTIKSVPNGPLFEQFKIDGLDYDRDWRRKFSNYINKGLPHVNIYATVQVNLDNSYSYNYVGGKVYHKYVNGNYRMFYTLEGASKRSNFAVIDQYGTDSFDLIKINELKEYQDNENENGIEINDRCLSSSILSIIIPGRVHLIRFFNKLTDEQKEKVIEKHDLFVDLTMKLITDNLINYDELEISDERYKEMDYLKTDNSSKSSTDTKDSKAYIPYKEIESKSDGYNYVDFKFSRQKNTYDYIENSADTIVVGTRDTEDKLESAATVYFYTSCKIRWSNKRNKTIFIKVAQGRYDKFLALEGAMSVQEWFDSNRLFKSILNVADYKALNNMNRDRNLYSYNFTENINRYIKAFKNKGLFHIVEYIETYNRLMNGDWRFTKRRNSNYIISKYLKHCPEKYSDYLDAYNPKAMFKFMEKDLSRYLTVKFVNQVASYNYVMSTIADDLLNNIGRYKKEGCPFNEFSKWRD
jgi:anti-sigma regulatory factor (Ser/Thr protein kinase)